MTNMTRIFATFLAVLAIAGCKREDADNKNATPVRPVLSMVVKPVSARELGFAGTIQPKYQTERGFRVLGRIIARKVYVGDIVKTGQVLAQLDPLPYDLAVRSSEAELAKAKSQLSNATGAESRSGTLLGKEIVSQADFEAKQQARAASDASVQQAQANLDKALQQRGYTTLSADVDGVITSVDADVGQIVSPGKKVLTIAQLDIREAVVDLPEDVARIIKPGTPFEIDLQGDSSVRTTGKVREIAPQADAVTRTLRVKITLDKFSDAFRFGTTITAKPLVTVDQSALTVPVTALLERDGGTRVWVVDLAAKTVQTVAVTVGEKDARTARITGGLKAGARVVTAGVNSLSEGQPVKVEPETAL